VFFFDASVDVPPGEFRLLRLEPCAARPGALEHHFTPAGLLALATELYGACPEATLVALGVSSFEFGQELSPAARTAVEGAVELLLSERSPN
jgi:hydrogenase maturation protease